MPSLIKNYYEKGDINSIINLHPYIQKYLYDLLNQKRIYNSNDLKNLNIILDLYENIFVGFCNDYFELPLEYNYSNYALTEIMDIIVFTLTHTIITTFYNTILKSLSKYLISITPKMTMNDNQYSEYINNLMENIISSNNNQITQYILIKLPLLLVKKQTGIYNSENDKDKFYNDIDLYEKISKIFTSNTVIQISEDSSFIKNMKNEIIPFFKNYMEILIEETMNFINNYFGYINSEYKLIKIIVNLIKYSIIESNKII